MARTAPGRSGSLPPAVAWWGLKPTRARITGSPDVGESIGGISSQGILSLTVRDSAALLDCIAGPAAGDPYYAEPPHTPYLAALTGPLRRLKIAMTRHSLIPTRLHPDCVAATEDAAALCEAQGHVVVEDAPPLDGETFYTLYRRFWPLSAARSIHRVDRQRGRPGAVDEVEPFNQYLFEEGSKVSALDYIVDLQWFHAATRAFGQWFEQKGYDAWLTPTLGLPPPPLRHFGRRAAWVVRPVLDRFIEFLPFHAVCEHDGPAGDQPTALLERRGPSGRHAVLQPVR